MKFKEKLYKFYYGRNGSDEYCRFLSWVALAFLLLSAIFGGAANGWLAAVCWGLGLAMLIYSIFRSFSKKLDKRRRENMIYLIYKNKAAKKFAPVGKWFRRTFRRIKDLPKYKYLTCPDCKTTMRVPRGKGTIMVTCIKCGNKFKAKS